MELKRVLLHNGIQDLTDNQKKLFINYYDEALTNIQKHTVIHRYNWQ
jgi:hypothetical protein